MRYMDKKDEITRKRAQNPMRVKDTQEESDEFFELIGETDVSLYESVIEKIDETLFDSFSFYLVINDKSFQFLMYKFLSLYNIITPFQISLKKLWDFNGAIQKGYFVENPYHNPIHIIDTLQAMHYLYFAAGMRKLLKKTDILASFIANIIHDYEHPGFTNQFVVRTKHPLAIRYNDQSVLENHHLASSFTLLYQEENNFLETLWNETNYELRNIIIKVILSTDLSQHFQLLTELKTKLDRDFPSDTQDDINLVISLSLKISDMFKIVRPANIFFKWMEKMFEEFYKQGDMEKNLDLPITKFMDRDNTDMEKAYAYYIEIVCKPLFATFLILTEDSKKDAIEEAIDANKKKIWK